MKPPTAPSSAGELSFAVTGLKALACVAVCCLSLSVGVLAQGPAADAPPTALTTLDQKFVRTAAADGLLEVELSRLAQARASGGEIKRLAERLVQNHGQLNAGLQGIAAARGVAWPSHLGRERQAVLDQLARLTGDEFDQAYGKQLVADHQRAVASFDQQALTGRDAELKAWASAALPMLREHLQAARALGPNVTLGR
ncbi:DUF4142 domain-containing protein [Ideonella sp.]|uniref:DUF4142 domain-containing protein n=1 Tax=Ideonella sp. TaxID=1929293 RepID=UPI0035B35682